MALCPGLRALPSRVQRDWGGSRREATGRPRPSAPRHFCANNYNSFKSDNGRGRGQSAEQASLGAAGRVWAWVLTTALHVTRPLRAVVPSSVLPGGPDSAPLAEPA